MMEYEKVNLRGHAPLVSMERNSDGCLKVFYSVENIASFSESTINVFDLLANFVNMGDFVFISYIHVLSKISRF